MLKNQKRNEERKKEFCLSFLSLISLVSIISLIFVFSSALLFSVLLSPLTSAQVQVGWCSKTIVNKTCQPNVYDYDCAEGFTLGRPSDCYEVHCILGNNVSTGEGYCQANVPYRTCIEELNGTPATPEVEQCIIGCCGVANRMVGITTLARCKAIARNAGYSTDPDAGYLQWYGGLENERECALKFAGLERGCCFIKAGECRYGYRKECAGNFFANTYCNNIPECNVKEKFKQDCGKMPGDEDKICWFDSGGNQEDCPQQCTIPAQMCVKCPGPGNCTNATGHTIEPLQPYCKNTNCSIVELAESQYYEGDAWGGDIKWAKPNASERLNTNNIFTGQSFCHNFFTGKRESGNTIKTSGGKEFPAVSTGLQNQKIVCSYGNLMVFATGEDRKKLCFEAQDNISAYVLPDSIVPDYSLCFKCGEGTVALDHIADVFRGGARASPFTFIAGYGDLVAALGEECTKNACENVGQFPNNKSWCVFHATVGGYGAEKFTIDAACVPRYPPGTTEFCDDCGGGGDGIYNMCEKEEAWAMGNCRWRSYGLIRDSIHFIVISNLLSNTALFNMVPWYVLIGYIIDCLEKTYVIAIWKADETCTEDILRLFKDPIEIFTQNKLTLAAQTVFGGFNLITHMAGILK